MLDFRIDTFIAVCKHMNFTHAAQELNITQPAVSQHIKYLQEVYGVDLFEHHGKKIFLTKSGSYLLSIVTTMKHDDLFLREKIKEKEIQRMSFGTTLTVGQYLLTDKMIRFVKQHEDVTLSMQVFNTAILLEKIDSGQIDFAMIEGNFNKQEYDYLVYNQQPFVAVCSKEFPLLYDEYTIEQLFQERVILREAGSGNRDILERYLKERNYTLDEFENHIEINNIQAIIRFVQSNCGISFVYRKTIEKELKSKTIKEIPIKDFPIEHNISLVWRKNSVFAPTYQTIFKELKKDD
ncbi:LysR family transcriptional regulator [Tannockella kyphosi]|uniref:LysR family transcriptional regulator n=1 Tax=Tannockella kyphosi TaxID=2899121 RepID=UPI002011C58E|nr:LysR family transcriptional regulator [Tannockella kyphosi]